MALSLRVPRRFGLVASLLLLGPDAVRSRLDVIDLPIGFFPEGITRGDDEWTAYVGSLEGDNLCTRVLKLADILRRRGRCLYRMQVLVGVDACTTP